MFVGNRWIFVMSVRALIDWFYKKSEFFIVIIWRIFIWNFSFFGHPYTEWCQLPLLGCHIHSQILVFAAITHIFVHCIRRIIYNFWDEVCDRRIQNYVLVFWIMLHVIDDCFSPKSRIHVPAPEVWLRSRCTSQSSTTYALGLARSKVGCSIYSRVYLIYPRYELCIWAIS